MASSKIVARFFSSSNVKNAAGATVKMSASAGHSGGMKLWRNLSILIAGPSLILAMINAYIGEKEHFEHFHRPDFIPYEHLRLRTKRFPWGDGNHSLFHNAKVNPLPDGYEN